MGFPSFPGVLNGAKKDMELTIGKTGQYSRRMGGHKPRLTDLPVLLFGAIAEMYLNVAKLFEEVEGFSNSAQSKQPNP